MSAAPDQQGRKALDDLTKALQELHRAAGRPSHRRVSDAIRRGAYPATVSHEGVRSALNGLREPRWETVESIVSVLAESCHPPRDPQAEVARFLPLWRAVKEGDAGSLKSARELFLQGWGGEDGTWTPEMVAGMLINPFNAVEIDPALVAPHEPLIAEEDWVKVALRVIEESGAEFFLHALLRILKGDYLGGEHGAPFGYRSATDELNEDEAQEVFDFVCEQMVRRLRTEPNLLARSIKAFHDDGDIDDEERERVLRAESDPSLMREVMTLSPESWDEVSEEAHWLVFAYLVEEGAVVGRPNLPPEQRFSITWRIPEPEGA
ncbi:hypothetical protein [Actinomadura rayongensis]|uniref:Uncharacterized protein n=1 Tax=Actinomadura rayongensis TaxID=1429076 RepID=A0A6I4WFD0_9ACTN|nr:hypothetical protein [Actinomadura rayongensis]MXQ65262.1 hypothetical protein [Actinomadura rayongensis]